MRLWNESRWNKAKANESNVSKTLCNERIPKNSNGFSVHWPAKQFETLQQPNEREWTAKKKSEFIEFNSSRCWTPSLSALRLRIRPKHSSWKLSAAEREWRRIENNEKLQIYYRSVAFDTWKMAWHVISRAHTSIDHIDQCSVVVLLPLYTVVLLLPTATSLTCTQVNLGLCECCELW